MNAHIQSLQDQVNELYASLNAIRGGQGQYPIHPALSQPESSGTYRNTMSPSHTRGSHPQFQGPTSSAYNFDIAKSSLQTMGVTEPEVVEEGSHDIDPALGAPHQQHAPMAPMITQSHKDPLWQMSKDDAIRLCKVYDEEMGIMYPMLDMEKTIAHAKMLFTFTEAAVRTGLIHQDLPGADKLGNIDVNILKMVLATALTLEGFGQSDLGRMLYESCREAFESSLSGPVEIKGLILLVIVVWMSNAPKIVFTF